MFVVLLPPKTLPDFDYKAVNHVQKIGTPWRWGIAKKRRMLNGKNDDISGVIGTVMMRRINIDLIRP